MLYLGFDISTQSASGLIIDTENQSIVWQKSLAFSQDLPQYQTENGTISEAGGIVVSPPMMWVEALELLMKDIAESGIALNDIAAISGSGQQHGSVYLAENFTSLLSGTNSNDSLHAILKDGLSRDVSPIWMDTSTGEECEEITNACSEIGDLFAITGSPATLRFTGPQIRKFSKSSPENYGETRTIHLVSSFICTLLCGKNAPMDVADASGMNLLDLKSMDWHGEIVSKTAPSLAEKLPDVVSSNTIVGNLSSYWIEKYGFSPQTKVGVFSGDNPCTLVGLGLTSPDISAISLGTSDTFFGLSSEVKVNDQAEGHNFASPTSGYMSLICYSNGSLAREKIREQHNLSWDEFEKLLEQTPVGNKGRLMLPYFNEEITPLSRRAQVYRFGVEENDAATNCRAIFEAQMMSQKIHSKHLGDPTRIHVTGGASNNASLLQIMSNVFNAEVHRLKTDAGASLGAALRAFQADTSKEWEEVCQGFVSFDDDTIKPDAIANSCYQDLMPIYADFEKFSLQGGKDPEGDRIEFAKRWS